jgi:YesN/AraC family two-component response regulator
MKNLKNLPKYYYMELLIHQRNSINHRKKLRKQVSLKVGFKEKTLYLFILLAPNLLFDFILSAKNNLKLYIKYMVSIRCKMAVKTELKKLGLHYISVDLGEVEILEEITAKQREHIKKGLLRSGLELMDDKKSILIEKIKNVVVEMVHYSDEFPKINFSDYLIKKLNYDYTYLTNIFSEVTGTTIEHFIIAHKIERAKELLLYDELSLSEISYKLNYSSVAHLSAQFKKATGLTPSFFRHLKIKRRIDLNDV